MKRKIIFCGRIILSLAIILYLFTIVDWERIKNILPKLSLGFISLAYFLVLLSILVSSVRWTILLKYLKIKQGVLDSWRYYLISMFFGLVLPGIIGRDAVRLGLSIKRHGLNMKGVLTTSVLFERTCGLAGILVIFMLTTLIAPPILASDAISASAYFLSFASIAFFVFIFSILKAAPERWFGGGGRRSGVIGRLFGLFGCLRGLPVRAALWIILLSGLVNFFDILASYYLAMALGINICFYLFLLIIPMTYVFTILPISLGGLGVREGILTFFLMKVGIVASEAVLLAFLIYLNKLAVALIGGVLQISGDRTDILKASRRAV